MRQLNPNHLIFSVYKAEIETSTNILNHNNVRSVLLQSGIRFKTLIGSYQGETEVSLLVEAYHYETILEIASVYKQESILFLGHDLGCELIYLDESRPPLALGVWTEIDPKSVLDSDSWTLDPDSMKYYKAVL
jgi:hypothetical protein